MPRLTEENVARAREIIARYPRPRSALIPLLHLAQEQEGWVSDEAMCHVAELLELEPAEVLGTCSFYEMFKRHPVGRYLVNVCTNVPCLLLGARELLDHAEERLGVKPGSTTTDGLFTIEDVECVAACTEAPCVQVNYRYFYRMSPADLDTLLDELRGGRRDDVPFHGTLARVRQQVPPGRWAGTGMLPPGEPPPNWAPDRPALNS